MTRTDRRRFLVLFAAIGALIALSGALAIPATAQAQEIVLVSNIAESHSSTVNINAPDLELGGMPLAEKRAAQRFTTGPNTAGYVLQSVVLNNPADPIGDNIGTAGNRTFSAASPLSLEANTRYWVMVSNTGTNSSFSTALTNSNNQTTTHGFSIRDTHHQGPPGSWIEGSAAKVRMEVRGTVAIPPLDVTLQLSDDGDLENAPPVTVTATVSPASPVAFTVTISATPVAPATDEDFDLSANRVLRFAANATASTGTVTISTVDDDVAEPTDVVRVSGAVSNAAIPDPDDVTLTIFNDDPEAFDIAVSAPAAVDEDAGAAVVTVTLTTRKNTAPVADIGMFYRVERGGTATRGADYTPPPGDGGGSDVHYATVRPTGFSPNAAGTAWMAAPSFTIGIIDDQEAERAETIVFAVLTYDDQSPAHTITIRDNDGIGPGPPTALGAEGKSQTQIRLAWTAPAAVGSFGITGYRIEVSENAGASWHVLVANTGSAEPNKFDNGLSAGDTRHYRVSAINPAGTSARLGVASATTVAAGPAATNSALPPPQDVNAVPLLPGEIRLSWWRNPNDASHDLVDRHQYRYRVRNASTWTVDWTTVNQTQTMPPPGTAEIRNYNKVLLEGLTAATTYEFQVRSMDTDGGTSAAVSAMGTAVDRQMVWIEATTRSVEEGAPLRFAVWRDQSHGRLRVILRISETGDMLPPEGRGRTGYWHEQVYFGDGNERIPLVLDTVDDGGGTEPDSVVTVEVMPHPLYPDNPDNEHLYDVQPDVGPTKITVTAAAGGSSSGSVAEPLPEAHARRGDRVHLPHRVQRGGRGHARGHADARPDGGGRRRDRRGPRRRGDRRVGDHGHAGHPRSAVDLSAPGVGLRHGRGGLHIGRPSPVHRGGAHRERPGSRHGACAADGDVPGERLHVGTAQGTKRPPAGGGGVQRTGGSVRGGHAIGVGDRRVGGWRAAARQGGAGERVRVLPHPRGPPGDRLPASREPGLYRRRHLHGGPAADEQQPLGDGRRPGGRVGEKHGGDRDADDQRDAAGRRAAERLDGGHLRRRRTGQRCLRLPMAGGRCCHRRCDGQHLHAGRSRRGPDSQGAGVLHR